MKLIDPKNVFKYLDHFGGLVKPYLYRKVKSNSMELGEQEMISLMLHWIERKYTVIDKDKIAYKTKMKSPDGFNTAAQARMILNNAKLFKFSKDQRYFEYTIKIANYLLSRKRYNGLIPYNNRPYYPVDEGIPTYQTILALVELYRLTGVEKYLNDAISLADISRNLLFDKSTGYTHTLGQDFWCTNASALASYSLLELYNQTNDVRYIEWIAEETQIFNLAQRNDGFFSYSQKYPGVFIYSYHNLSLYYLAKILSHSRLQDILGDKIMKVKKNAADAITRKYDTFSFTEENKSYSYIISMVTAYAYFKFAEDSDRVRILRNKISQFFTESSFYLYERQLDLFRGYNDNYKDILATEILYWLMV